MLGRNGWEPVVTAFLEDGRYLDGGALEYTVGRYTIDGDKIRIDATMFLSEGGQTVFGTDVGSVELVFEGEIRETEMRGEATDGKFRVQFRGERIGELP